MPDGEWSCVTPHAPRNCSSDCDGRPTMMAAVAPASWIARTCCSIGQTNDPRCTTTALPLTSAEKEHELPSVAPA
eukprot:2229427-Prymnesium_polylepis.2